MRELIQIYSNDLTQNLSQFTHNKLHYSSNTERSSKVMPEQNRLNPNV